MSLIQNNSEDIVKFKDIEKVTKTSEESSTPEEPDQDVNHHLHHSITEHLKSKSGNYLATITAVKVSENQVNVAWAKVHKTKNDKFKKSEGIRIAKDRCMKGRAKGQTPYIVKEKITSFMQRIAKYFKNCNFVFIEEVDDEQPNWCIFDEKGICVFAGYYENYRHYLEKV